MARQSSFTFAAKTIFLTYPQCTLSKEDLLTALHELFTITDYCICEETHADGAPHLHAFLKLASRIQRSDARFADIQGFHPNITAPRSIKAVIEYIKKVSGSDC